jgi:CubicO group peptidase (beta-lactamase class C family)
VRRMGRSRLAVLLLLLGTGIWDPAPTCAATAPETEPPLRLSEPTPHVVADLAAYIPRRLHDARTPGLSIALIRGGRIVWTSGFGVANRLTREPVTPQTVFAVASIGKVAAAYSALRLVEQDRLSLDDPVADRLSRAWLPASAYGDDITLRQLLSHTSGLTNQVNPLDRIRTAPPGRRFAYSGVGFMYLQEIIQQVTGSSLEDVAQEVAFGPLGMVSTSFVVDARSRNHLASGHMSYRPLVVGTGVPFAVAFVVLVLAGSVSRRIRSGRWSVSSRHLATCAVLALVAVLAAGALLLGRGGFRYVVLGVLCLLGFGLVTGGLAYAGRCLIRRCPAFRGRTARQNAATVIWLAVTAPVAFVAIGGVVGPVPNRPGMSANAAFSLHTTAPDLAALLIEIGDPHVLDPALGALMRAPQVQVNADNSWGLGIGVQHSLAGDSLWHTGDNPDVKDLMVMYPEHGLGVVVLTNGEGGMPVAYDVARRALGGKSAWRIMP